MTAPRATGDGHRLVSWFVGRGGGGGLRLLSMGLGRWSGAGVAYPPGLLVGAAWP